MGCFLGFVAYIGKKDVELVEKIEERVAHAHSTLFSSFHPRHSRARVENGMTPSTLPLPFPFLFTFRGL